MMVQEGDHMAGGQRSPKECEQMFFFLLLSMNGFEQGSDWCFRKIVSAFIIYKSVAVL